MRLIDADAFKEYIRESFEEAKGEFQTEKYLKIADSVTEGFLKDIDEQPTVEAKTVVHGEWEKARLAGEYICSNCQSLVYAEYTKNGYKYFNFCPECGADMRKKVE